MARRASRASSTKTRIETWIPHLSIATSHPSRASSTKTRIETVTSPFQDNQNWIIKSKFHENKDWNKVQDGIHPPWTLIKSKFHENKDWNYSGNNGSGSGTNHQEQVPRKQGLKQQFIKRDSYRYLHQEQVPRKQGLKLILIDDNIRCRSCIKSKFHENKDWNSIWYRVWISKYSIKSKFHENKDWNQLAGDLVSAWYAWQTSRASSTKTRIETCVGPPGIKPYYLPSRASSTKTRIETSNRLAIHRCNMGIKSKFHENKDWNPSHPYNMVVRKHIKSKFHENKDWNSPPLLAISGSRAIKSKFHENKDWNSWCRRLRAKSHKHQEQVPRKQGLKHSWFKINR